MSQTGGETEASIMSRKAELKLIAIHRELSELVMVFFICKTKSL